MEHKKISNPMTDLEREENDVREALDGIIMEAGKSNKNSRIYETIIPKLDGVDGLIAGTTGEVSPMPTCVRCLSNRRVKPDKNGYVHCTNCGNYWIPSK